MVGALYLESFLNVSWGNISTELLRCIFRERTDWTLVKYVLAKSHL